MTEGRIAELLDMFNNHARIARTFGMTLSFDEQRRAVIDLPYNPGLDHGLEGVHGGVLMTLLDTAAWFTAAAAHEESIWVATSELTAHLLKPVTGEALRAIGALIQRGRRQDVAEAHVYATGDRLVAHGIGTFVVLPHLRTDRGRADT